MGSRLSVIGGAVAVGAGGLLAWPYTVDDAYIVARFVTHILRGDGYVMNPGGPWADGVTGPLALMPGLLGWAFGLGPLTAAKALGWLASVLAAVLWLKDLARRREGPVAAGFAALVLGLQPSYVNWASAGLGTGLAALLLAVAARGGHGIRSSLMRGGAAGAIAWVRPELVPVAATLLYAGRRPARWRVAGAAGLLLLVGVVGFRWWAFGDPWPLSVRAKPAMLDHGIDYGLRGLGLCTGVFGVLWAGLGARAGRARDRVGTVALIVGLLAVVLAGGDWMPGFRLLAPLAPLYAVLAGRGLAAVARRRGRRLALMAAAACVTVPALDYVGRVPRWWQSADSARRVQGLLAPGIAAEGGRLMLVDVGRLAYTAQVPVADLGGVTDPAVADLPGGHLDKRITPELVRSWRVSQVLLHSRTPPQIDAGGRLRAFAGYPVELRAAAILRSIGDFTVRSVVPVSPSYHYIWLVREPGQGAQPVGD